MLMVNPAPGALLPFWLAWLAYRSSGHLGQIGRAAKRSNAPHANTCSGPRSARPSPSFAACPGPCAITWSSTSSFRCDRIWAWNSTSGNNENYDDVHPRVFPYLITKDRELYRYSKMGEMPFVHEEMRKAVNFIVSHPRVEVRLTADRAVAFWMGTPTPLRDFHRADTFLLQMVSVCNLLAVLGTLGGIAVPLSHGAANSHSRSR